MPNQNPSPLANALSQYAPQQQPPPSPLSNALLEYAKRVGGDFQHGLDESAQGFGEMVNGQFATGLPRTFLGGLGWMGAPVSGALSPLLEPILGPVAQGVHDYAGKPIENSTGYPADLATEILLAAGLPKVLHGAGKVTNAAVPYLARIGDEVGSRIGAPADAYMSGAGPTKPRGLADLLADAPDSEISALKARLDAEANQAADWWHGSPTLKSLSDFTTDAPKRTDYGYLGDGMYVSPKQFIGKAYAGPTGYVHKVQMPAGKFKDFPYVDSTYQSSINEFAKSIGVTSKTGTKEWAKEFSDKMQKLGYVGARGVNSDGSFAEGVIFNPNKANQAGGQTSSVSRQDALNKLTNDGTNPEMDIMDRLARLQNVRANPNAVVHAGTDPQSLANISELQRVMDEFEANRGNLAPAPKVEFQRAPDLSPEEAAKLSIMDRMNRMYGVAREVPNQPSAPRRLTAAQRKDAELKAMIDRLDAEAGLPPRDWSKD